MQTVYVNNDNQAVIICQQCERWKAQDFSPFLHVHRPLKAKCSCGAIFDVIRELRKTYRKPTYLQGRYTKNGSSDNGQSIYITNISQGGLGFQTILLQDLHVDDTLALTFVLDDNVCSKIYKRVRIKHIDRYRIGSQFSPDDAYAYRKEIGCYLMSEPKDISRETVDTVAIVIPAQLYEESLTS